MKKNLIRCDNREIVDNENDILLFFVVRNEMLRLPYFYFYYRQLGVTRFFAVDNASTDSTKQYLLEQPDTFVFYTDEEFGNKEFWLKDILDRYAAEHWCLVVDADELFQYPYIETVPLGDFCSFLDRQGDTAIESILVDMYPKGDIRYHEYRPGDDLIRSSPYFDPYDYDRVSCIGWHKLLNCNVSMTAYFGGTRKRVFDIGKLCCSKFSLFKYSQSVMPGDGMHSIIGVRVSEIQGVVLHFKFLQDFVSRTREEVLREVHFCQAREYKKYKEKIDAGGFGILLHDDSLKYSGSRQMLELGFMRSSLEYDAQYGVATSLA